MKEGMTLILFSMESTVDKDLESNFWKGYLYPANENFVAHVEAFNKEKRYLEEIDIINVEVQNAVTWYEDAITKLNLTKQSNLFLQDIFRH